MNEFLKMDIFFFVATLGVVLFICFGALATWQITRILKNIEHISSQVALESDEIRRDLAEVRADIRSGKGRLKSLFRFFTKRSARASKET